jgi:tetratricopeptide (TPR) repeat protein
VTGLRWALPALTAGSLALAAPVPIGAQDLDGARASYVAGRYDEAVAALRRSDAGEAVRLLVRVLGEVGRYAEALDAARRFERQHPDDPRVANVLGETLWRTGDTEGAARAFERGAADGAPDSLDARFNLARLWHATGRLAQARRGFDAFIDAYNGGRALTSEELTAVAGAVRYLGATDWRLFRDALRAYDEAIAADPDHLEAQIAVGDLFLEKYQGSEALEAFTGVLDRNPRHPDALLGLARQRRFAGSPEAMAFADSALATNPRHPDALVFRATLYVELEDYDRASADLERALAVNPRSIEAMTVQAGLQYLRGDRPGFDATRRRVLAVNPAYAEFFATLAELSVRNRLYAEAVAFAREAADVDSTSWRAHALLGINELRLGAMREGRASLERAFAGDPFDAWTKNTLDLLDTLQTYSEIHSARFIFAIDGKESDLLGLYVGAVAEEAYERLAGRYGFRPSVPVRVEIFPDHQDFSVRTVGLTGFGALGVSFGPVVAMDSPSARNPGEFHWASTLWHEIAHTFHLGLSEHRVPRWYTEGLAVYEERRARPGWGDRVDPGFLLAFKEGRLHPVSELNNGFVRPAYPEQLLYSYYEASLVCDMIAQEHGPEALTAMLQEYRDGRSSDEVIRSVLGSDPASFDGRFDEYVRARFAGPLAALTPAGPVSGGGGHTRADLETRAQRQPDDFVAQLAMGQLLLDDGQAAEAIPYLERAKRLFPQFAGAASPYLLLARAHRERGNVEAAATELRALTALNAGHYRALLDLAEIEDRLGNAAAAADALDRAMYVYPLEIAPHRRLAELAEGARDWARAVRERRAVLALRPVDRADALYRLARAYFGAERLEEARRTVLQALEMAPAFEAAQTLLLEIHDARTNR